VNMTATNTMTDSAKPFAAKKSLEIKGRRMAYIDEGEGAPIVFAHGNPTSSYLWRNVMPACRGLGRLIACDMIGMGDSEKLPLRLRLDAPARRARSRYRLHGGDCSAHYLGGLA
jgi:haloalkane dehalogenase